jgi:hypothetical protein
MSTYVAALPTLTGATLEAVYPALQDIYFLLALSEQKAAKMLLL